MKQNNTQPPQIKELPKSTPAKSQFLILITILLVSNLLLIVFSVSINNTLINPEFVDQEFKKYSTSEDYESDEKLKELFEELIGLSGFFYFIFYLLIIFSLILTLFIVFISYKNIIMTLIYLAGAAISASVISYIVSILAFKLTYNQIQTSDPVLSEQITVDILSNVTLAVKDYAVILLLLGLMLLLLTYISQKMIKFLTNKNQ